MPSLGYFVFAPVSVSRLTLRFSRPRPALGDPAISRVSNNFPTFFYSRFLPGPAHFPAYSLSPFAVKSFSLFISLYMPAIFPRFCHCHPPRSLRPPGFMISRIENQFGVKEKTEETAFPNEKTFPMRDTRAPGAPERE